MMSKSDLSPTEEIAALKDNADRWNAMNSGFEIPLADWEKRLNQAKAEGYKSEKCECGVVYLAFHHFTTCRDPDCPFSDGVSLLQQLSQDLQEPDDAERPHRKEARD